MSSARKSAELLREAPCQLRDAPRWLHAAPRALRAARYGVLRAGAAQYGAIMVWRGAIAERSVPHSI